MYHLARWPFNDCRQSHHFRWKKKKMGFKDYKKCCTNNDKKKMKMMMQNLKKLIMVQDLKKKEEKKRNFNQSKYIPSPFPCAGSGDLGEAFWLPSSYYCGWEGSHQDEIPFNFDEWWWLFWSWDSTTNPTLFLYIFFLYKLSFSTYIIFARNIVITWVLISFCTGLNLYNYFYIAVERKLVHKVADLFDGLLHESKGIIYPFASWKSY